MENAEREDLGMSSPHTVESRTARKIFMAAVGAGIALVLILVPQVFILFFCCVLFAVLLVALCRLLEGRWPLQRKWSLSLTVVGLLLLAVVSGWVIGPQVTEQFSRFASELPKAVAYAEKQLLSAPFGQELVQSIKGLQKVFARSPGVLSQVSAALSSTIGVLVQLVLVFFVGLYLASDPDLYINGFAKLFPPAKRARIREIFYIAGATLRRWLCGRLLLMGSNGVITALGLWLMGIPLAFALGLISALLNFVPNFGPIVAAIPAVLIALLESPTKALYVAIFYLVYQMFDGYVLTPLVQRRTVSLPPAIVLMAQVLFGILFGTVGVLVAVPLATLSLVFFREVYVKEVLNDQT